MLINLKQYFNIGDTVAVAVSGGKDSMSLLYYMLNNANLYSIKVIALNIEHGIRGESSVSDTEFVKKYCNENNVPILTYSVDSIKKAKEDKLSIEQAARILRYKCFQDAINSGKCDKVATAHHLSDNTESVLFNLFRGTGLSGLTGIKPTREDNIVRPLISVSKAEIDDYIKQNAIPFVTDETNLSNDYTRNYIRNEIIPKIKLEFPELDRSIARLATVAEQENSYLDEQADAFVKEADFGAKITLPCPIALLARATIKALKLLGVTKDWEKSHIDGVTALIGNENGSAMSLPKSIIAVKEYDGIVFYKQTENLNTSKPFSIGITQLHNKVINIELVERQGLNLANGLYADLDKIPQHALLRTRTQGDLFTKFGGGTKSLGDFMTDKKIPLRLRNDIPLLANGNEILCVFGVAISDKVKVDENSKRIIKLSLTDK